MAQSSLRQSGLCRLAGYDYSALRAMPGESIKLRFYWQAIKQPESNYSVFIHLTRLVSQDVLAQADGAPGIVERPTLMWDDPNETIIGAPSELRLPANLQPGSYRILIGLYDYNTGRRLQTATGADIIQLLTITVTQAEEF